MAKRRAKAVHLEIPTSTVKWKGRKKGDPVLVGYARVSMKDQNNQRQIDELVRFGVAACDIWQDKKSGKTADRPGWKNCFRALQPGDNLVILSLDRLGRNVGDLIEIEKALYQKGVKLRVIQQPIDTSTSTGRLIFNILGYVSQFEREWNWDRTMHGLKAAKERGVVGGRREEFTDEVIKAALAQTGGAVKTAARIVGCKPMTIIRRQEAGRV